jgi:hypothetical protein
MAEQNHRYTVLKTKGWRWFKMIWNILFLSNERTKVINKIRTDSAPVNRKYIPLYSEPAPTINF